jgi:hypothetical protein
MDASRDLNANNKIAEREITSERETPQPDPLFLFAVHLLWHRDRDVKAYQELVAALDDPNPEIRALAEDLLHRSSPRRVWAEGGW